MTDTPVNPAPVDPPSPGAATGALPTVEELAGSTTPSESSPASVVEAPPVVEAAPAPAPEPVVPAVPEAPPAVADTALGTYTVTLSRATVQVGSTTQEALKVTVTGPENLSGLLLPS